MLEENLKKIYYIPVPVPPTSKTQQEGELNLFDLFTNPNPQSLVGPDIGGTTLPQIKQNTIQDQELALDDIRTNTLKSFITSCSDGDCPINPSSGYYLNCCWANNTCQENYCKDENCTCNNSDGSPGGRCNDSIDCSIGCLCRQFKTPCFGFSGCMYPAGDLKPGWGKYECTDPNDGGAFYLCDEPCGISSGSCSTSLRFLDPLDTNKKYGITTCGDLAGNSYQYVETISCETLRNEYNNYWATNCGGGLRWESAIDRAAGIERCKCEDTRCEGYDATDCWDPRKDNESLIMNIIGLSLACSQQTTSLCGATQIGEIEDCEDIIFYRDEQEKNCSQLTCADLDAGLGKYCVLSDCTQCCGNCGTPCGTGCCKTCGSECDTANDCTKYSQCLAKTGNYAPGGTCESCPCTDPCGSNCETSTKSEYDNCILNCQNSCCCTDPCVGAPTDYWTCVASSFGSKGCCNKNCDRDCGGLINSCSSANANCKKKISEGGCCKCAEDICATSTKNDYENCLLNVGACDGCCTDPCIGAPSNYFDCIVSPYAAKGCCSPFSCLDCGSSPCTDSHSQCNTSTDSGGCCVCKNTACKSTTNIEYNNCKKNADCIASGCCTDPCIGAPSNYFDCIASPYAAKGCCSFSCSDCGSSPCTDSHSQCNTSKESGGCCVCKNTACKSTTNIEYNNCKLNTECLNTGCCIDPCIDAPKDFNDCIRSPYLAKGCCIPPVGPCTECPYCQGQDGQAGTCSTLAEYNACLSSGVCTSNNCCIYQETDPCDGCSDDCNTCRSNATCVANGCCRFNCSQMTCPDSSTVTGYRACMNNNCCKTEGCCTYPCTGCPKNYSDCIKNTQCNLAGCCIYEPQPCDSCTFPTNQQCLQSVYCSSNGCCAEDPCFGCLDGSPNSYYTCMTNSDCRTNGCCGEAPCTLNKCFTSTKQEYLQCLNNPDCNDSEYPCCDNPCKTCSTNYFECMRNDACVRAGCCAIAPTCLDCKTDPAYPNASCTHPDSRCSNSPETGGCCNCKSSRCQTSTKSEYTTCGNVINKSFCKDIWGTGLSCCSNPCTGCATKQDQFGLCITQSGCANKGCCTQPPQDPCAGCKQSNCSSIAECARNACCKETPICENCNATYATCITSPTCVANGCCPPDPCVRCNRNKTVEGFAECSADARCVANNCCNDPCDQCKHIYYTECSSDVYCSANNCCPPLPCPTCPENYEECISNEICRLYCCCVET
jgi:hypothetical protein